MEKFLLTQKELSVSHNAIPTRLQQLIGIGLDQEDGFKLMKKMQSEESIQK